MEGLTLEKDQPCKYGIWFRRNCIDSEEKRIFVFHEGIQLLSSLVHNGGLPEQLKKN